MKTPPLYAHQRQGIDFLLNRPRALLLWDPGTGKTRTCIEVIRRRPGKTLILAPKSILQPAWGTDFDRFAPEIPYSIAYAGNRAKAFSQAAQVYITNHDAVKWLIENPRFLEDFQRLIVDESTAIKNRTADRSRALARIRGYFPERIALTGTFIPNSVLDAWHQVFIIDDGLRLGQNFFAYRAAVCQPRQTGPRPEHIEWVDKPHAQMVITDLLKDIASRQRFEDCISIPENVTHTVPFYLAPKHRDCYTQLQAEALLTLQNGEVTALNAAVLTQKLLQVASGAVYTTDNRYSVLDKARYELIIELIQAREACVVAFNWTHQKEMLCQLAQKARLPYDTLDGGRSAKGRTTAVERFQSGELRILFIHPQSGAHGLTLTRGSATIWASPTYNAEHYQQFNRRIYRAGQTRKTETLLVCAQETLEPLVYSRLQHKLDRMETLKELLKTVTTKKQAA